MSKEYLEAFKNLKQELYYSPNQIPDIDKWHETIEEALLRLKSIDDASPSEALKDLENLSFFKSIYDNEIYVPDTKEFINIKQALIKSQEQKKALKELKKLIDDLEPTFNRKGVSSDTNILGTIIKNYFYDNASELLCSWLLTEDKGE